MAGQSATMSIGKARSMAKGAGRELGMNNGGGSKACAPTEGKELGGKQKGYSSSAGDVKGKKAKTKAMM